MPSKFSRTVRRVDRRLGGVPSCGRSAGPCRRGRQPVRRAVVAAHAAELNADPRRIVLSGHSAGGHLALMAGLAPPNPELDGNCPWREAPQVAALVNWFGITDVADLLDGSNRRDFAVKWIGGQPNGSDLARRLSPPRYVRADAPPVITAHGDVDDTVPYAHAERLHAALRRAGTPNVLVAVQGGVTPSFPRVSYSALISRSMPS